MKSYGTKDLRQVALIGRRGGRRPWYRMGTVFRVRPRERRCRMAGRSPKPWFWKKRGAWYVNLRGERVRLGPDKAGAFRTFHLLMARAGGVPPGPQTRRLTLGDLAEKYL